MTTKDRSAPHPGRSLWPVSRPCRVWLGLALLTLSVVAVLLPAMQAAHAAPASPPPRPTPIPTATPVIVPPSPPQEDSPPPIGALIELDARSVPEPWTAWTAVQWQDGSGRWHTVEGWQGAFDQVTNGIGKKVWWLSDSLLGQGPFRWAVYHGAGGRRLAAGEPFFLPDRAGERLVIDISLTP